MVKVRIYILFILIFCFSKSQGQSYSAPSLDLKKPTLNGFAYPTFLNGEQHSYFILNQKFTDKFEAELQGFYDTYLLSDVIRFAVRGKYFVGDKFYLFSGIAVESERDKINGMLSTPRLYLMNGTGFDVNNNLNLELKHEFQINKASLGNYGLPSLLSVHGKYKF